MRGNDLHTAIIDAIRRQARRLACGKGLIALGFCTLLIVLPVCLARSRNGTAVAGRTGSATAPVSHFDNGPAHSYPRIVPGFDPGEDLDSSVGDPILQVWRQLPSRSASQSSDAAREAGSSAFIESLTIYPSSIPHAAAPASSESRQLVEEIQRRLARIQAGAATSDGEQQSQIPPQTQTMPRTATPGLPLGLDTEAPLQLYEPQRGVQLGSNSELPRQNDVTSRPVEPVPSQSTGAHDAAPNEIIVSDAHSVDPAKVDKSALEGRAAEGKQDPNLNPSPAALAAFDRHCEAGQLYQQQGRYVRAADAFTLALAYRPNDSRAYLGKGYALFAAGQYPGSASALAKALELDPQRALKKVDLVRIAGGPDGFLTRFNDLAGRTETNPMPEQQFLLAYVYYQMDQPEQAKTAIEAARKGPFSPASVETLAAAISH